MVLNTLTHFCYSPTYQPNLDFHFIPTLLAQIYAMVGILLVWKYLHDCIISLGGETEVCTHNTSLTPLYIEVSVPSLEIERSCMCVGSIDFAFVTAII